MHNLLRAYLEHIPELLACACLGVACMCLWLDWRLSQTRRLAVRLGAELWMTRDLLAQARSKLSRYENERQIQKEGD